MFTAAYHQALEQVKLDGSSEGTAIWYCHHSIITMKPSVDDVAIRLADWH